LNSRDLLRMFSAGISNQAISSFTNFAFSLYLLRQLEPIDFGLYNISFAIMLFLGGFGQSFFLLQMVVNTPSKPQDERAGFAGRILLMLVIACILGVALIGSGVWLFQTAIGKTYGPHGFLGGVGAMAIAYILKEFQIRHAFNEGNGRRAVLVHTVLALALLGGVILLLSIGQTLGLETAVILYAGAHLLAAIAGHLLSGLSVTGHSLSDLRSDLAEITGGGIWASLTNIVYFLRGQAHTIIVAILIGPVGVASVNAARLLVTPAVLAIPALSQVVLPRLAAIAEKGDMRLLGSMQRKIALGLLAIAISYSALLILAWPLLSGAVLGEKYSGLFVIVVLWCIYACTLALRNSFEWVAQARKKFREISVISLFGAVAALASVAYLVSVLALEGAVVGAIFGEVVMIAGLALIHGRRL